MPPEQTLFISYAHIDDLPLSPGQQGWVTRFHATLQALLSMRLGYQARIWRDEKLQGNDVFSDEIVAQFERSAVLVSVLSSRYLHSEWCTRELREFCASAQRTGGVVVGNKARVFKVVKTPVDGEDALPPLMRELLGYDFFTFKDGAPLELDPAYGQEFAQLYNQKVAKLAWDVSQLLKSLFSAPASMAGDDPALSAAPLPTAGSQARPAVYLAECSFDRRAARELVEGELLRLGYTVFPQQRLPADEADYARAVAALLRRCELAVHLVGEHYGAVPDGPSLKSVVVHQNEQAVERCRQGGLTRLIWLPAGTQAVQPHQQTFIDALHQNAGVQFGADLITGGLAELRAAIHATLQRLEAPPPPSAPVQASDTAAGRTDAEPPSTAPLLYLLCDERDRKATVPLRKWCRQAGLEVGLPAFEGDAAQLRQAQQQMLSSCDAVLVFYGSGDEGWKRSIDAELRKLAAYRAGRPAPARFTYLAWPRSAAKEDLIDMEEPGLIDGLGGFDPTASDALAKLARLATRGRQSAP